MITWTRKIDRVVTRKFLEKPQNDLCLREIVCYYSFTQQY